MLPQTQGVAAATAAVTLGYPALRYATLKHTPVHELCGWQSELNILSTMISLIDLKTDSSLMQ